MPLHIADGGKYETSPVGLSCETFHWMPLVSSSIWTAQSRSSWPQAYLCPKSSAPCQRISDPTAQVTCLYDVQALHSLQSSQTLENWYLVFPEQSATPKRDLFKAKLKVTRHSPKYCLKQSLVYWIYKKIFIEIFYWSLLISHLLWRCESTSGKQGSDGRMWFGFIS